MSRSKSAVQPATPNQAIGVHHPYDKAARYAIHVDPQGFLNWFRPGLNQIARYIGWANTRGLIDPDAAERVGDTVADLASLIKPDLPLAISLEAQTIPEADFLDRALGYAHVFRRTLRRQGCDNRYHVFVGVIHLTGRGACDVLDMNHEGFEDAGLRFKIISRNMADEDAAPLLDQIDQGEASPCMLYWVSLMRNAENPDIIKRWKGLVERFIPWEERRNLAVVVQTFSELSNRLAVWREFVKEWPVIESMLYKEWTREAELRSQTLLATTALEQRFGSPLPNDIAQRIANQPDVKMLAQWLSASVNANSLDQVRSILGITVPALSRTNRDSETGDDGDH